MSDAQIRCLIVLVIIGCNIPTDMCRACVECMACLSKGIVPTREPFLEASMACHRSLYGLCKGRLSLIEVECMACLPKGIVPIREPFLEASMACHRGLYGLCKGRLSLIEEECMACVPTLLGCTQCA
eukprot:1161694-Pelagomonas_calceolata.AAC.1